MACTCDKFCDEPCAVHFRENQLQEQVALLTQERDALLASKWAGPWKMSIFSDRGYITESCERCNPRNEPKAITCKNANGTWRNVYTSGGQCAYATLKEAQDAIDQLLREDGWWLS